MTPPMIILDGRPVVGQCITSATKGSGDDGALSPDAIIGKLRGANPAEVEKTLDYIIQNGVCNPRLIQPLLGLLSSDDPAIFGKALTALMLMKENGVRFAPEQEQAFTRRLNGAQVQFADGGLKIIGKGVPLPNGAVLDEGTICFKDGQWFVAGEGIVSTAHAQKKPPTLIAQVDKSKETTKLDELLNTPEYRHLLGLNYLFTSPFVRIEHKTFKDGSAGICIVKRGIKDGEYDQIVSHISIKNGELTTIGGSPITEAVPIPLEESDKKKPIIQYLLSKHAIEAAPVQLDNSEIAVARKFFAIHPSLPQQRETVPLKDIKPDHSVGMARYAVDKGDKKIVTVGLANCVGLTIYNPEIHTGGVAHFDPNQKVGDMLDPMLGEFGKVDPAKIEIRLIGGWSGYSERTIYYLKQNLESRGFKITSEDVLGENISRSIMLDTTNGKVIYLER